MRKASVCDQAQQELRGVICIELGIIVHIAKTLGSGCSLENELKKIGSVTLDIGEVSGIGAGISDGVLGILPQKESADRRVRDEN